MEKERKITAPEGCKIEKVEIVDGVAVVTFREKKRKLPKSWEEFCEIFPIKKGECSICAHSDVIEEENEFCRKPLRDRNVYPDRATAEAVLALCQLIQLRNCYNGDWVPDWTKNYKYVIEIAKDGFISSYCQNTPTILYFKTKELRDEFLRNFNTLIEKLKPLYGVKEGGEEC
jgi:hypothetical protein